MLHLLTFLSLICWTLAAPSTLQRRDDAVQFTVDLSWDDVNPTGGIGRKAILTNGTSPGPVLNLKVGQYVEFTVINNLPFATSVHFHGIQQTDTPYSDGVPGLTQTPILPGSSFLYTWTADEAGTYFYHAHYKGQMMDGLYGAIIIEAADDADRPFGLISGDAGQIQQMLAAEQKNQPIFISDWSQFTFNEFYNIQQAANVDNACADSIILNGMGSVYCLSRDQLTAFTAPQLGPILAQNNPSQITDKGCLPPNLVAVQGNYTFDLAALPAGAFETCIPATGQTYSADVDPSDGWAALTFINSGGFSSLKFTIDNHKPWVYAVDGSYVNPQQVDQVIVNNGDRYSVLIKLDQAVGQYQIRVANNGLNQVISGYGVLNYKGASGPAANAVSLMNFAGVNTTAIVTFNDIVAAPYPAVAPAASVDATHTMNIKKLGAPWEWTLSGINPWNMTQDDLAPPLLFRDPASIPASDTIIKTNYNQWIDLIVTVQGPIAQPHPLHKHANKVYVLGSGVGTFNYSTVAEAAAAMPAGTFNFANPPYRDGYTTPPAEGANSWVALRYQVTSPGAWMFHCHMQTHFSGGMAVVLIDGVDKFPAVPQQYLSSNGFSSSQGGSHGAESGAGSESGSGTTSGSDTSSGTGSGSATASGSGSGSGTGSAADPSKSSSVGVYTGDAVSISLSAGTLTLTAGLVMMAVAFAL